MTAKTYRMNVKHRDVNLSDHHAHTRYTTRIKILKSFLVVIASLALLVLLLWPQVEDLFLQEPQEESSIMRVQAETLEVDNTLLNPRMQSVDSKGRPYDIKADTATAGKDRSATLENPESKFVNDDGTTCVVQAKNGYVDEKQEHITYEKNVTLDTNTGYHFETDKAHLDMTKKVTHGVDPIKGKGPTGAVESTEGFEVDHNHGILRLKGRAKLTINQ